MLVLVLLLGGMLLVQAFETLRVSPRVTGVVGEHPITVERVSDLQEPLRHSLSRALGTTTVHTVLVDTTSPPAGVDTLTVRLLHGARSVTRVSIPPLDVELLQVEAPLVIEGGDSVGRWRLLLVDADATTLLATRATTAANDRVLIDVRLVPDTTVADVTPPRTLPRPERTLLRDVLADAGVLLLLTLAGGALLPTHAALRPLRAPLGLVVGVAALASTGLLLIRASWSLVVVAGAALAAVAVARQAGAALGWRRGDLGWLAGHTTLLVGVVAVSRARGLMSMSGDSFTYLLEARALALGQLDATQLNLKRLVGQQALHAPGFVLGAEGVQSLGPALLVAGLSMLVLLPLVAGHTRATLPLVVSTAAAGIVASSQWMWFMASYVNSHVLVAVTLLGAVLLWWFATEHPETERTAAVAVGLLLVAIVVVRAEAVLLVGLLLVGTLVGRERVAWPTAWWAAGGALIAWNGVLTYGAIGDAAAISTPVLVGFVSGLLLVAAPTLLGRLPGGLRTALPGAMSVLLWGITAAYLLLEVSEARPLRFFAALRANLGLAEGGWGVTAPFLLIVALLAVWSSRTFRGASPARSLVVGFVPITLLAKVADGSDRVDAASVLEVTDTLLSGGGRVGWSDSGNRMLTHVVLVIVFLAVLTAIRSATVTASVEGGTSGPTDSSRVMVVLSASLALIALTFWEPQNLGRPGPTFETVVHTAPTGTERVTLAGGSSLAQHLALPAGLLPSDTRWAEVCAEVLIANPGGARRGALDLTIEVDGTVGRDRPRAAFTFGDKSASVCVEIADLTTITGPATVTVTGEGGDAVTGLEVVTARPVGAVASGSPPFVVSLSVGVDAPSTDPRPWPARAVSVAMRRAILDGPNAALLLGAASMVIGRGRARTAPTDDAG